MKIGFIGLGNMASAIIGGITGKGIVPASDIIGADKFPAAVTKAAVSFGIRAVSDNIEVVTTADILFLAVKPQMFPEVIAQIRDQVKEETVIVSIAPGKTIA